MRADDGGMLGGVLHVVRIRDAALDLVHGLHQPRREAALGHAEMKLADEDGQLLDGVHAVDEILRRRPAVLVHAVHVEAARERDDIIGRRAAEADAEIQVVRIMAPHGGVDDLEISRERGVHQRLADRRCVALGELALEALLDRACRAREHQVDELAFARRPWRLVADEVADHPRVGLACPRAAARPRHRLAGRTLRNTHRAGP